jgi:hypothetical protein
MLNKLISLKNLIWFCAIGLAVFSGYYSVYGISKLFSGGSWSIVGMAGMLEFSKLVVITFLHDHYKTLKTAFKVYLMSSAVILMILTSVGVYGYLTNSYQETAKEIYETQNKIGLIDKKKEIFLEQKSQIDTLVKQKGERITSYDQLRLSQENSLNNQLTQKKGTKGLQKNIQSVDNSTQTLNKEISELNQKSIGLSDSIAKLEQEKLVLDLSRLSGAPMDVIVNWFILVLVSVFDPLAVSLVIAANHLTQKEKEKQIQSNDNVLKTQIEEKPNEIILEEISENNIETEPEELNSAINDQITDSVTVKPKENQKKIKKEKKHLENTEENVILNQSTSKVEEDFYDELPWINGYRRGRKN